MIFSSPYYARSRGVDLSELFPGMASVAGSYVSGTPTDYVGGMASWSPTQTFDNNANRSIPDDATRSVFRDGDTDNSTWTVGSEVRSYGFADTTFLAWQSARSSTTPQDPKINGTSVSIKDSENYDVIATDKTYYSSWTLAEAPVELTTTTNVSVDFQTGSAVGFTNDKGGFLVLPGRWESAGAGSQLSDLTTPPDLVIPARRLMLLLVVDTRDSSGDSISLGTNANLDFLMCGDVHWYDRLNVAIIGNGTDTDQNISYSLASAVEVPPKPYFFKLEGTP